MNNNNLTINSIEELRTRLDEMAKEFAGANISATESKTTDTAYKNAFFEHLHTGLTSNVLKKGSEGAGGYLVPDTYEAELVQALRNKNLMRRLGTIISTTSNLKIPVVDAHGEAFWVEEGESYSFTNESFGQIEIDAYKLAVAILVSDEMLEDSGIDLEAYIKSSFADALGDAEEEAFLTGNGKGKPVGIIHQTEAALEVDTLSSITLDDVIDLEYSLKQPYRKNAVFIMSEEAYLHLRKIKTFNGKLAWEPSLTEDEPEKLLGRTVFVTKYLNSEYGNTPILYGDFSYYWIGDREKRHIKRLSERYADRGLVGYQASQRVDAKLVLPEAIKSIKVKSNENQSQSE